MSFLNWNKIGASAVAIVATEVFAGLFDDVLFPFIMAKFGLGGGLWLGAVAVFINYGLVAWYRRTERDWYGFEAANKEELEEAEKNPLIKNASKSRVLSFILLSIKDPFVGFVYYEGRKAHGMKFDKRDWTMFVLANVIGVSFWVGVLEVVSNKTGSWALNLIGLAGLSMVFWKMLRRKLKSSSGSSN